MKPIYELYIPTLMSFVEYGEKKLNNNILDAHW